MSFTDRLAHNCIAWRLSLPTLQRFTKTKTFQNTRGLQFPWSLATLANVFQGYTRRPRPHPELYSLSIHLPLPSDELCCRPDMRSYSLMALTSDPTPTHQGKNIPECSRITVSLKLGYAGQCFPWIHTATDPVYHCIPYQSASRFQAARFVNNQTYDRIAWHFLFPTPHRLTKAKISQNVWGLRFLSSLAMLANAFHGYTQRPTPSTVVFLINPLRTSKQRDSLTTRYAII